MSLIQNDYKKESNSKTISIFNKEINSLEYRDNVFSKIERNWKCRKFCDLILKVDNKHFHCHKSMLATLSKYFQCLISYDINNTIGNKLQIIILHNVNARAFSLILDYIYCGHVNCDSYLDLSEVIITADYLLLNSMLDSISVVLRNYLSLDNAVDYYHLGRKINSRDITSVTMCFIVRNMYNLHLSDNNDSLNCLSIEELIDIIQDKRLIMRTNRQIYFGIYFRNAVLEVIDKWIEYNRDQLTKQQVDFVYQLWNDQLMGSLTDKLKLETLRYVEPISRAYFMNSSPYGRHPPCLVTAPHSFRCLGRNIKRTFLDNPPHKWYIKKLVLYIIPDWNNATAIADVDVDYKHYWTNEVKSYRVILDSHFNYQRFEVELGDDERIIKIHIYHSWLIYGMKFYTSTNRILGTYGTKCGELTKIDLQNDYPHALYLHGFAYLTILSRGWQAMNWLTIYGAMIDKDSYYQDFYGVPFEHDWENNGSDSDIVIINDGVTRESDTDNDEVDSELPVLDDIQQEDCLNNLNYALPHTIEDLFYQWRRYMRLMRLSIVRRADITLSNGSDSVYRRDEEEEDTALEGGGTERGTGTTTGISILPGSIPGLSSHNISSPEVGRIEMHDFREV